jgi:hypothetical protein
MSSTRSGLIVSMISIGALALTACSQGDAHPPASSNPGQAWPIAAAQGIPSAPEGGTIEFDAGTGAPGATGGNPNGGTTVGTGAGTSGGIPAGAGLGAGGTADAGEVGTGQGTGGGVSGGAGLGGTGTGTPVPGQSDAGAAVIIVQ